MRSQLCFFIGHGTVKNEWDANVRREFRAVTGACLMIDRGLFREIGEFDERYINGCEDTDLCLRVIQNWRSIVCNPRSV